MMMAGIIGSRIAGVIRDRVIAHQFGQSFATDTYQGAFTIPDLIFFLIAGGALSSAFIPVFSEYIETGREEEAWRIFAAVSTIMTLIITALIVVGELYTRRLVMWTNPGFIQEPGKVEETMRLTRILLPAQLCFFLGGLMMGTQTARHIFHGQALGPIIYNVGIIFGGLFLTQRYGVAGLCYGAVSGAVIGNLLLQWFIVRRTGGGMPLRGLRAYMRHPGVKKVWKLMLPVILGLALPQVAQIVSKMFASLLHGNGPQSALVNAYKLMQIPVAIFGQASAIAIFPVMTAQAARKDTGALRHSVNLGIRSILFLTIPASVLMCLLALPVVQCILQTGRYSTQDAMIAAAAVRCFAVGTFAWSANSVISRGFYALQDSRTPVIVGTVVTFVFVGLNFLVLRLTGRTHIISAISGLALVASIAAVLQMSTLFFLLRLRLHGLEGGRLLRSVAKTVVASAAAGAACLALRSVFYPRVAAAASPVASQHVFLRSLATLVLCIFAAALVYGVAAILLRMEEVSVVNRLVRRRSPAPAA